MNPWPLPCEEIQGGLLTCGTPRYPVSCKGFERLSFFPNSHRFGLSHGHLTDTLTPESIEHKAEPTRVVGKSLGRSGRAGDALKLVSEIKRAELRREAPVRKEHPGMGEGA